jgi:WD40 repeat protein
MMHLRTVFRVSPVFASLVALLPIFFPLSADTHTTAVQAGLPLPELVLRTMHERYVRTVAYSPDGRWIASGDSAGTVKLWDAVAGHELRSLPDARGGRSDGALAISRDGTRLVSGVENDVVIWDAVSGRALHRLTGHTTSVLAVGFGADARTVVSIARGQRGGAADPATEVKTWDASTGLELRTWTNAFAARTAVSSDGRVVALSDMNLGTRGPSVKIIDVATGREQQTLLHRVRPGSRAIPPSVLARITTVNAIVFNPDGRLLVTAAGAHALINAPASNRDAGDTIRVWDVATGRELRTVAERVPPVHGLAVSSDGRWIAAASGFSDVCVLPGGVCPTIPSSRAETANVVTVWEAATGREVRKLVHPHIVAAVAFSPDSRRVASVGWDQPGRIWDIDTGELAQTLGRFSGGDVVGVSEVSADGRWLALTSGDVVKLWDLRSGHGPRSLRGHTSPIMAAAFSPDSRVLATGGGEILGHPASRAHAVSDLPGDSSIKLWDVTTGREIRTLAGQTHTIRHLAFSPDGRVLLSATKVLPGTGLPASDHTRKVWDVATGRELHTPAPSDISMNRPAGQVWEFATGHELLYVRDAVTGRLRATLVTGRDGEDWLVVTPEGLFDGSPGAWSRLLWRFGQNTFDYGPVEVFFNEFYHPGLLADILAGKDPRARRDIARVDRRQPEVTLAVLPAGRGTVTSRTITVEVTVAEAPPTTDRLQGSGVRDVRLFRNGSLVRVWRGDVALASGGRATLRAEVPIVAGQNQLTAYAFNRENIKSADASQRVVGAESVRRRGTLYVVTVGIDAYANADYELRYAVADATALGEEVRRQQLKLGAFARVEVVPLLDRDATKANILSALGRLAGSPAEASPAGGPAGLSALRRAEPEDAVIVYFAGHGTAQDARFYLVPHDLGYTGQRGQVDRAGLATILARSISDVELEHAFENVDAGRIVLIIDACNSGQALEAEEKRRGPMNSRGLAQLAYEKGMYVLTAAQGYQAALEARQFGHGLLTYALVEEALKTLVADVGPPDGRVVVQEWLDHPTRRVPELQQAMMHDAQRVGRDLVFVAGDENIREVEHRSLQHPRVFYRREPEADPLVVARPDEPR